MIFVSDDGLSHRFDITNDVLSFAKPDVTVLHTLPVDPDGILSEEVISSPRFAGLKEAEYRKEVVSEDKINARIGQMLHLDAMVKERPVVFHVEAVGESTYQMANERSSDELTEAKLAYVHINSKDIKDGSILSLLIKDTDSIEVYGFEAERAAKSNNIPLFRVNGVPVLSFPNTKDGKKALATCVGRTLLTEISIQQLTDWYHSHKVLMEKENKKGK